MDIRKLAPGDRVLDYRVLERIGEGGFGQVFRAEHEVLERIVALKVPRDQGALTALRHEGVVQATLDHPNIVKTVELSISHNPPYVIMEYVNGQSMAELLKRQKGLPWRRAATILLATARALAYAHGRGVIHGDVKPGNILLERGKKGRVLLTDFGLGRVFEGPQGSLQISRSLELANSGAEIQGTIRYLAPELLRGESADERADVYSFGILLFESVTGRLPEGREIPSDLVKGQLPPEFDRIFEDMFARKERRPRTFDQAIALLAALVEPDAPKAKATAPKTAAKQPEILRAIPVAVTAPSSARRHHGLPEAAAAAAPAPAPAPAPLGLGAERESPEFVRWRRTLVSRIGSGLTEVRGLAVAEGRGFDGCFGVNVEGEPHHRIYALVLPKLDAATARATVAEARRVFDLEKGIWEKEVTFWVIANDVTDHEQVLWTLKSFSMGWWRRRRIVLHDVRSDRVYATELGCDPRGNPLKRAFMSSTQRALREAPFRPAPATPLAVRPRVRVRGTLWGAALALVMTMGLLASIMGVKVAQDIRQKTNQRRAQPQQQLEGATTPAGVPARAPDVFIPADPPAPRYY
jgi:serine/threonine protein kinase